MHVVDTQRPGACYLVPRGGRVCVQRVSNPGIWCYNLRELSTTRHHPWSPFFPRAAADGVPPASPRCQASDRWCAGCDGRRKMTMPDERLGTCAARSCRVAIRPPDGCADMRNPDVATRSSTCSSMLLRRCMTRPCRRPRSAPDFVWPVCAAVELNDCSRRRPRLPR